PEAGAVARRDPVHRRDHAGRVPQVDRKRPFTRAPVPGGEDPAADRSRRHQDSVRYQRLLRKIPRRRLHRRVDRNRGLHFEPFYSDEERKERENMQQLREKYHLDDTSTGIVTKDDIEDVVARWTGVPMTAIKEEEITKLLRIEEELHKRIISQEKAISALARA